MSSQRPPSDTLGLAALARTCEDPAGLQALWSHLMDRASADASDSGAFHDLATLLIGTGQGDKGLNLQAAALADQPLYRTPTAGPRTLTLLAFAAPGDFTANTPLDFLLEGSGVELITWRLTAPPAASDAPPHDLAFVAIGESEATRGLLEAMGPALASWPRPVLNRRPELIAGLTRDAVADRLAGSERVLCPKVRRLSPQAALGSDLNFPLIARPVGTHAGHGMTKIDSPAELEAWADSATTAEFYLTDFVDYAGPDGLYRKLRVVFIDRVPFIAHMAVSERWMVHYLNAGMDQSAAKRAEEAAMMETFDEGFARRHAVAFTELIEAFPLDYFGIDCAETQDGRLLVFEADVAMIVHAMDSAELYPYKQPAMTKFFNAFQRLLHERSQAMESPARSHLAFAEV